MHHQLLDHHRPFGVLHRVNTVEAHYSYIVYDTSIRPHVIHFNHRSRSRAVLLVDKGLLWGICALHVHITSNPVHRRTLGPPGSLRIQEKDLVTMATWQTVAPVDECRILQAHQASRTLVRNYQANHIRNRDNPCQIQPERSWQLQPQERLHLDLIHQ